MHLSLYPGKQVGVVSLGTIIVWHQKTFLYKIEINFFIKETDGSIIEKIGFEISTGICYNTVVFAWI